MLVLSRKDRETVVVGGPDSVEPALTITVLEARRGRVRLGIEGDREIRVHRGEVWEQIRAARPAGRPAGALEGASAGHAKSAH